MSKCVKCGSYAFNLYKEDIDQGGLCDVHYWQYRAHRAEALAEQPAPASVGSLESLKLLMQHSAWEGVIQLSDALKNIDECSAEQPVRPYRQLQDNGSKYFGESWDKVEQPAQQEPVAWGCNRYIEDDKGFQIGTDDPELAWGKYAPDDNGWWPLYTSPPAQRTWVGLTYEEAKEIYTCIHGYDSSKRIAEAIEAKLKEKNNG